MFLRRTLLCTARLLLGAFLLAQSALAIAACDWSARDAARAVVMAAGGGDAPCHESGQAKADSGLCLTHCLGPQQSLDKPSVVVPALGPVAILWTIPVMPASASRKTRHERPLAAAAPPFRILFQSFQI